MKGWVIATLQAVEIDSRVLIQFFAQNLQYKPQVDFCHWALEIFSFILIKAAATIRNFTVSWMFNP